MWRSWSEHPQTLKAKLRWYHETTCPETQPSQTHMWRQPLPISTTRQLKIRRHTTMDSGNGIVETWLRSEVSNKSLVEEYFKNISKDCHFSFFCYHCGTIEFCPCNKNWGGEENKGSYLEDTPFPCFEF